MKVKKLNESTSAKLKTKANGDYLVANEEGDGYSAYTKEDEYIGHLSAKDDAEAVDNFSQVQPKLESTNEDYLNSAEFRIQRYEDEIPELFHKVHDGYMSGMVNAKAYADALARIHSALEELNYSNMNESMPDPELDTSLSTNETSMEVQDNIGNTKEPNKQFNENTITNTLPEHLDNFLMDIAQEFGEISYLDISLFGKVATDADLIKLNELKALYLEEAEYDDPESLGPIVDNVVKLVKSCCEDSKQLNEEDIAEDDLQHEEGDEDSEAVDMNEEYDDNFDDLSSFNKSDEVRKADALYGVEERDKLVESVYIDTSDIMRVAGETYTTAELRKIWNDNHNDDPSMAKYNGDYDKWVSDTLAQMSRNDDVDEAFDMSYGPDLDKLRWQVASFLDVDALGEDNWIEFDCDEPRGLMGSKEKTMRFQAIGENAHKYGYLKTAGSKVEVHFRNESEAVCNNAEEIARFIAGEFGISI